MPETVGALARIVAGVRVDICCNSLIFGVLKYSGGSGQAPAARTGSSPMPLLFASSRPTLCMPVATFMELVQGVRDGKVLSNLRR